MAVLQIFAGKKTGLKKNVVDGIADWLGNPATPYIITDDFSPSEYGVASGTVITNTATGISTTINFIELDRFMILTTNIFSSVGDIYEIVVNENVSDVEYTELDLFDDETIEITQNIKDFKDISKILTDYTQSFKIPASKTNNRYFEHYYNQDIVDGFDARFRYDCILKLNGVDWKKGQIRLTSVGMKDGYADNYDITFYGGVVSLKDILGEDELDALPYLDAFNHELSFTKVASYAGDGANLVFDVDGNPTGLTTSISNTDNPDLIYPFISNTKNRYYHDESDNSPDIENVRNVALLDPIVNDQYHNILYTDLKPAIRVIRIIRAIESRYGIKFSDDFISESSKEFEMLYLLMSRDSGGLSSKVEESSKELFLSDFSFSSGVEVRTGDLSTVEVYRQHPKGNGDIDATDIYMRGDIIVAGSGSYSLKIINNETAQVYLEEINLSGDYSFDARIQAIRVGTFSVKPKIIITTKSGIQNFTTDLSLESKSYNLRYGDISSETGLYSRTATQTLSNGLDIRNSMTPKIKCIDFLKSVFKMFNIVAYVEDGIIVAKPYDDYYREGKEVDLTYAIDFSSHKVSRSDIYSEINFKYKDAKDFITIKRNELTNTTYGNLDFSSDETSSFDGGKYSVDISFTRPLAEGMVDVSSDLQVPVMWGYSVSEADSPINIDSLIFTSTKTNTITQGFLTDGISVDTIYGCRFPLMDIYYDAKGRWSSINMGEELTPYIPYSINSYTQAIDRSLFYNFYRNQVLNLYNKLSRQVSYTCYPSVKDSLDLKLNDTIIVNSNKYIINSLKNNLLNGKSEISLISKSIDLPLIEENQFYEINKDGDLELFSSYESSPYYTSVLDSCTASVYPYGNRAIGENGYVYSYIGNDFTLQEFPSSPNFFCKLIGYTHDVIEIDETGLIVNKHDC